jgi:tetratricopeptide (TPR) repeat protein
MANQSVRWKDFTMKKTMSQPSTARKLALVLLLCCAGAAHADMPAFCGELTNGFGPYDYRNPDDRKNLGVVEKHHFNAQVEMLTKGVTGSLGSDIDYTLRAFPNHLRALGALGRLAIRDKSAKPIGANYTVECYFDRALRFRPKDGLVYMAYGDYLSRLGQESKAIEMIQKSIELEPFNATAYYNLGLIYLKKKDYDQALGYAQKAYEMGFPLPGLKKQLVQAGKWTDAPVAGVSKETKGSDAVTALEKTLTSAN